MNHDNVIWTFDWPHKKGIVTIYWKWEGPDSSTSSCEQCLKMLQSLIQIGFEAVPLLTSWWQYLPFVILLLWFSMVASLSLFINTIICGRRGDTINSQPDLLLHIYEVSECFTKVLLWYPSGEKRWMHQKVTECDIFSQLNIVTIWSSVSVNSRNK